MKKFKWLLAQFLELRWWKNYLRDKNKTEYLEWKKNYWKNVLEKISDVVKVDSSKTICDLGCGPTGIFIALPQNKVTAVDPLLNEYEKHIPLFKKSEYPNVQFVECTIEDFNQNVIARNEERVTKQAPTQFDFVFCMNAINHVHDINKAIDKLKEVCVENGTVVVTIDAHNYSFFKYLFRLIPGDALHPHQYNLEEYEFFLEKRGFKILKTELLKQEFLFGHWVIVAKNVNSFPQIQRHI
jgi:2-polyprenyl-6-hydroxyphenyl methylase/3-demethylubiquinone-9 3-methyltransferase